MTAAEVGWFRPYWSTLIEKEWLRNAIAAQPAKEAGLRGRAAAQRTAFPDAIVDAEPLIGHRGKYPPADDLHVLASAIKGEIPTIITFNLSHFPDGALARYGIRACHPDAYLQELPAAAVVAIAGLVRHRLRAPMTVAEQVQVLRKAGVGLLSTADRIAD